MHSHIDTQRVLIMCMLCTMSVDYAYAFPHALACGSCHVHEILDASAHMILDASAAHFSAGASSGRAARFRLAGSVSPAPFPCALPLCDVVGQRVERTGPRLGRAVERTAGRLGPLKPGVVLEWGWSWQGGLGGSLVTRWGVLLGGLWQGRPSTPATRRFQGQGQGQASRLELWVV